MKNPQVIFLIIIVAFGLVMGGYLLNPSSSTSSQATPTAVAQPADPALIHDDKAPVIGKSDAKVKLVIFSDYECPYCKNAHDIINDMLNKYPNDVNVEVRNFIVHPTSAILAQGAEAANKQGKFKEYADALFSQKVDASEAGAKDLAKSLKINTSQFEKDLNSDDVKNRVSKDNEDAQSLGLQGTPSIFMNNKAVENFNNLESLIKQELGQ